MKADLNDPNTDAAAHNSNVAEDTRPAQDATFGIEKFSAADMAALRQDLLQAGVDSFQAAEIVANFLTGRGYGCSSQEARSVASSIEVQGATAAHIQAALENVARVM
jgi:hypothetical protein